MTRRRTPQQEQELLSRRQLAIAWSDWVAQGSTEDLGEDFLFQIYEDGSSSGLSFFLQLKSTKELNNHTKGDYVSYSFEVKDLKHWEQSAAPVVLLIWDVGIERGVWMEIRDAIAELERRNPKWRHQKTASVRLPVESSTEPEGRENLRLTIFHREFPVLSAGKTVSFKGKLSFPGTDEGRKVASQYQEAIDSGGEVTIPGDYITEFVPPEWWLRAAGTSKPTGLTISSSKKERVIPLTLSAGSGDDERHLPATLRHVRGGNKFTTFEDTAREGITIGLRVDRSREPWQMAISCSISHVARTVRTSRQRTEFLLAASWSGTMQLYREGDIRFGMPIPVVNIDQHALERWLETLKLMAEVERHLPAGTELNPALLSSETQLRRLWELRDLLAGKPLKARANWSFNIEQPDESLSKADGNPDSDVELTLTPEVEDVLGVQISSGTVRAKLLDGYEPLVELLSNWPENAGEQTRVELTQVSCEIQWTEWSIVSRGEEAKDPSQ